MAKEVLALDLDDVVLATAEPLQDYYNKVYGANLTLADYYTNDLKVLQAPDLRTAVERFNIYLESDEFFNLPPTQEAVKALEILNEHFTINAVTGRSCVVEKATTNWLARHFSDIFSGAIFTDYYDQKSGEQFSKKAQVCRQT